ncbi:MAG: helix-turn-helix transcriptional regulator [Coriobacteriia bacterium]
MPSILSYQIEHDPEPAASATLDPLQCIDARGVCGLLGISRETLWRWTARAYFPEPLKLGGKLVRWRRSTIDRWLRDREGEV